MRIGIIGGGVVGRATARCFLEHVEDVCVYDVLPERQTHSLPETLAADLIFVCLPTPQKNKNLDCDLTSVESFFADHRGYSKNFILRSTVPIGTTRRLWEQYGLPNLIHSPEFLTARCAATDAQLPARNIVGIPDWDGHARWNDKTTCRDLLLNLYRNRFPGVPIYYTTADESESVKLFTNAFFAVKLAYWNEVRMLADKLGLNWERVIEAVLADGRISHSHTKVPGPDGKFGFGGSCLPGWYSVETDDYTQVTLQALKRWFDAGHRPCIRSIDGDCRRADYKRVLVVTERQYDGDLVVLETGAGVFSCTPEHLMPVLRGGTLAIVQAQDILETDELLADDEPYSEDLPALREEETCTV